MAVVAGVLTFFLQSSLNDGGGASRTRNTPREVVVAARDIAPGSTISDADLAVEAFQPGSDARGAVSMKSAVVGRVAVATIRKGQMVHDTDLASRGSAASIASELPAGYRAITVTLRDAGAGVVLYPGALVDVMATVDGTVRGSGRTEAMTRTVAERSRVLAVNDETIGAPLVGDRDRRTASRRLSVAIAVTPEQAAQIELASARGTVGIALCPQSDPNSSPDGLVTTSTLLGLPPEPEKKPEPAKPEPAKPEAAKPEQPKPAPAKPAEASKPVIAEKPKSTVWEVVVDRGAKSETITFEAKPASKDQPANGSKDTKQ